MNNQVLSIEQMLELIDMGIDISKAHLWWYSDERTMPIVVSTKCNFSNSTYTPTFTLQDILEILPKTIVAYKDNSTLPLMITITGSGKYAMVYDNPFYKNGKKGLVTSESLLEAAFKMLKWVKQNNYI